jgi:hypothetical protein
VSQDENDDDRIHPEHRKEPNVKNVAHSFPLKPTVNNHGGLVNWKLARESNGPLVTRKSKSRGALGTRWFDASIARSWCKFQFLTDEAASRNCVLLGADTHMYRNNLIVWLLTGCFIALVPSVGMAKTDVHTAMTALQDATGKVGAPVVQGNDLYFGDTKASPDVVDAVVKSNGGVVATIFVKSQFVRVATTVKKEDGSSAVGTVLDANSPALSKLKNGQGRECLRQELRRWI